MRAHWYSIRLTLWSLGFQFLHALGKIVLILCLLVAHSESIAEFFVEASLVFETTKF
jgi:hypothetical protein